MDRFLFVFTTVVIASIVGCGSATAPVDSDLAQSSTTPVQSNAATPSAADVVSQFLDEVRRGGEHSRANELLTEKARVELRRIGQAVQPLESPDARFEVTRAESVPGEEKSALVHSIWSEPNGNGTNSDFQVVWAVQQEPAGWRISGLAMELDPNQDPVIMDFENAEMMSQLLAPPENAQNASTEGKTADDQPVSQANAADPAISR